MAYRPVLAPLSRDSRKDLRTELPRGSYVVKGVSQETVECGPALRPRQHPRAEGQFNLSGTAFGASAATVTFQCNDRRLRRLYQLPNRPLLHSRSSRRRAAASNRLGRRAYDAEDFINELRAMK
jgi:hypothetical protein